MRASVTTIFLFLSVGVHSTKKKESASAFLFATRPERFRLGWFFSYFMMDLHVEMMGRDERQNQRCKTMWGVFRRSTLLSPSLNKVV